MMSELRKLDALILAKLSRGDQLPDYLVDNMNPSWREHARKLATEQDPEQRSKLFKAAVDPMGSKGSKFLNGFDIDAPLPGQLNLDDLDDVISGVTWLWKDWLPNGHVSLLVGESERGKSYLALALAKCVVEGLAWPDGTPFSGEPGKVAWCECECNHAALRDRRHTLNIAGEGIVFPGRPEDDVNLDNAEHRARAEMLLANPAVRLLVIDTLSGSGRDRNENATGEMMGPMGWLAKLAQVSNKAILAVHHTRKKPDDRRYRITRIDDIRGSTAITQWPRSIIAVDALDPKNERHCRVGVIKANFAEKPSPFGYENIEGIPVFNQNPPEPMGRKSKVSEARDWLREYIETHGPTPISTIEAAAKEVGHSSRTLYRVKHTVGISSRTDETTKKKIWEIVGQDAFAKLS